MKSLKEYLISEKLKLNSNTKNEDFIRVPIPAEGENSDYAEENGIWKTIEVPFKKYVIFKDNYRFEHLHFAILSDFLCQLTQFQSDYEDYTPEKYILYADDDMYKVFEWYANEVGVKASDNFNSDVIEKKISKLSADNPGWFEEMFDKNYSDKDFEWSGHEPTENDLEKWPEYYRKYYG